MGCNNNATYRIKNIKICSDHEIFQSIIRKEIAVLIFVGNEASSYHGGKPFICNWVHKCLKTDL